jgi:tetratricopeptide (TPR) repeat protein
MAALNQAGQEGRGGSYSDLVKTVDQLAADYEEDVALAEASNAAVDLVRAGKLDEAEQAARDLLVRFPEVHDGYDRLGMVYEARGDNMQAAHYYRQVPRVHSPAPGPVRRCWIGSRLSYDLRRQGKPDWSQQAVYS